MKRGYSIIALYGPRDPANVAGTLRASMAFGAQAIILVNIRSPKKGLILDAAKAYRHLPTFVTEDLRGLIPIDCEIICVEKSDDAISSHDFIHPERACYVFGPENGNIPEEMTNKYKTVAAPTRICMNLAATVNVILYDRSFKYENKNLFKNISKQTIDKKCN